jgi:integrase
MAQPPIAAARYGGEFTAPIVHAVVARRGSVPATRPPALACLRPTLPYAAVKNAFQRLQKRAGLNEDVTAHILRHTMATTLLFNGWPIGHIKVALGHERVDTTCRYYLGLDLRAAKEAHQEFLKYE